MPSATSPRWGSAAAETLSSRTSGTSEPQTLAMTGRDTASQPFRPQLQAARRRRRSRPRRPRARKAETRKGRRNGASFKWHLCMYACSDRASEGTDDDDDDDDVLPFCILSAYVKSVFSNHQALHCITTTTTTKHKTASINMLYGVVIDWVRKCNWYERARLALGTKNQKQKRHLGWDGMGGSKKEGVSESRIR